MMETLISESEMTISKNTKVYESCEFQQRCPCSGILQRLVREKVNFGARNTPTCWQRQHPTAGGSGGCRPPRSPRSGRSGQISLQHMQISLQNMQISVNTEPGRLPAGSQPRTSGPRTARAKQHFLGLGHKRPMSVINARVCHKRPCMYVINAHVCMS